MNKSFSRRGKGWGIGAWLGVIYLGQVQARDSGLGSNIANRVMPIAREAGIGGGRNVDGDKQVVPGEALVRQSTRGEGRDE